MDETNKNTTETEIETGLIARSVYVGFVNGFPFDGPKDRMYQHHHYKIDIVSNGKVETFDFYDSFSDFEKWIGKGNLWKLGNEWEMRTIRLKEKKNPPKLSGNDLILAVGNIFEDALSGRMDLCEFMDEYGYDNCKQSIRTWKACRDSYNRLIRMGSFSENDMYRIVELIREKEEAM